MNSTDLELERVNGRSLRLARGVAVALLREFERVRGQQALDFAYRLGTPRSLVERLSRRGDDAEAIEDLRIVHTELIGDVESLVGLEVQTALHQALHDPMNGVEATPWRETWTQTPRWPSGVEKLDFQTRGGFYGVTALGGDAGAGKSLFALQSCVAAAKAGMRAIYCYGEMTESQVMGRVSRAGGGAARDLYGTRLICLQVRPSARLDVLVDEVWTQIDPTDSQVVVCIDSLNEMAESIKDGRQENSYFDALNHIVRVFREARRDTEGKLGVIFVSELNARGEVKGLKLEYACDLLVNLKAQEDHRVEVVIKKGREGGRANLGMFRPDWQNGGLVAL